MTGQSVRDVAPEGLLRLLDLPGAELSLPALCPRENTGQMGVPLQELLVAGTTESDEVCRG